MFLHLAAQSGKNLLLCGPAGSGKTSLINDFLYSQGVFLLSVLDI
jgi:type IV secretory pathway ATPase VirB11/archaellum biosynthesis ATPase